MGTIAQRHHTQALHKRKHNRCPRGNDITVSDRMPVPHIAHWMLWKIQPASPVHALDVERCRRPPRPGATRHRRRDNPHHRHVVASLRQCNIVPFGPGSQRARGEGAGGIPASARPSQSSIHPPQSFPLQKWHTPKSAQKNFSFFLPSPPPPVFCCPVGNAATKVPA